MAATIHCDGLKSTKFHQYQILVQRKQLASRLGLVRVPFGSKSFYQTAENGVQSPAVRYSLKCYVPLVSETFCVACSVDCCNRIELPVSQCLRDNLL